MITQAVIRTGNKQYLVHEGQEVAVEKINSPAGQEVIFDDVLLLAGAKGVVKVLPAELAEAQVTAQVIGHFKAPKEVGLKYKPKKRYRRKYGHRQLQTRVRVEKIRHG